MSGFSDAFRLIDHDIPRIEHGRDLGGIDCVGLIFLAYRIAGHPIDHLDLFYRDQEDADARLGPSIIRRQLASNFQDVTRNVQACWDHDGDIWLFPDHVGIQCGGEVWHMSDRLHRQEISRVRPFLIRAYRERRRT